MKAEQNTMPTVVSALTARTQLGQILKRVKSSKERFLIGKNGQPQAMVMGIDDYIDTVSPAQNWLKNSWRVSEKNGNDKLTMPQIDAIISKERKASKTKTRTSVK